MPLSRSLRCLCSLSHLSPLAGFGAWQVPTTDPTRNVAWEQWIHRSGMVLGFTFCFCLYVIQSYPGGKKYLSLRILTLTLVTLECWRNLQF